MAQQESSSRRPMEQSMPKQMMLTRWALPAREMVRKSFRLLSWLGHPQAQ